MTTLNVSEARSRFSELIDEVEMGEGQVALTRGGKEVARLVSPEVLESLNATIEVLSDPHLLKAIRQGEADRKAGRVVPMEEVFKDLS